MKKQTLNEELSRIKQIMNENMDLMQDVSELGIPMPTPQEVEAIVACDTDDVPQEHRNAYMKIKAIIKQTQDKKTLKQAFKDLRNALRTKRKQQEEQAGAVAAVTVLGVPLTTIALGAIGLLLLIGILQRLFSRREGGGNEVRPSCRAGASDIRREFGRKLL